MAAGKHDDLFAPMSVEELATRVNRASLLDVAATDAANPDAGTGNGGGARAQTSQESSSRAGTAADQHSRADVDGAEDEDEDAADGQLLPDDEMRLLEQQLAAASDTEVLAEGRLGCHAIKPVVTAAAGFNQQQQLHPVHPQPPPLTCNPLRHPSGEHCAGPGDD